MENGECSICNQRYDGAENRPRALPCGHGFCTECIDGCIARNNKSCPVCRMIHGANSAKQLPVNFPLEELLHKATISAPQQHVSDTESEEESLDMCTKHKGIPLYFHCKSHNLKVCHSCVVIDHPNSSCTLMSLDDHVEEKKNEEVVAVQKQKQRIMDMEKDLKNMHTRTIDEVTAQNSKKQDLEKEVELLLQKIEEVNQMIMKKHKSKECINAAMQSCQENHKTLELLENKLRAAKGNRKITKECQTAAKEISKSKNWEEKLRSDLDAKTGKFAQVKRNGTLRSSRVLFEGGRTLVPCLNKDVIPSISADLMQEAELGLDSPNTTVFLDFSALGRSLGQVHIRVLTDRPQGKQFVMLALGTDGPSYRGANLEKKDSFYVELRNYVTESKSKSKDLILILKSEHKEIIKRGNMYMLTTEEANFQIAISDVGTKWPGYFGDVISGLEVIDRAMSQEFDISDIMISECGILF